MVSVAWVREEMVWNPYSQTGWRMDRTDGDMVLNFACASSASEEEN